MGHDLNAVEMFVAVVNDGTFRGAARRLGVPKSNISRKVADLETQLGVRLLHRTTRQVVTTEAGRAFHEAAALALSGIEDATRLVGALQAEPTGTLRVTTSPDVGTMLMPSFIQKYLTKYPRVSMTLDLSAHLTDIVRDRFDLAVRAGPLQDSSLIAIRLGDAAHRVYGSPEYFKRRKRPRSLSALSDHECLVFSSTISALWRFADGRRTAAVKVRGRLAANSMTMLREAAIAGLGLAQLPSMLAADAVAAGSLVEVLDKFAGPPVPLHAVYPDAKFVPPKVRAFVELMKGQLDE
ncbi:MAG: LysR family transcriptional regulator [Kofleriaceae bacterium]